MINKVLNEFSRRLVDGTTIQQLIAIYLMYKHNIPTYPISQGEYEKRPEFTINGIKIPAVDIISIAHIDNINGIYLYETKAKACWFPKFGSWVTGFNRKQYEEYLKYGENIINRLDILFWHSMSESRYNANDVLEELYPGAGLWGARFVDLINNHIIHDKQDAKSSDDQIFVWTQKHLKKIANVDEFIQIIDKILPNRRNLLSDIR